MTWFEFAGLPRRCLLVLARAPAEALVASMEMVREVGGPEGPVYITEAVRDVGNSFRKTQLS
jgi:hypothetical protein